MSDREIFDKLLEEKMANNEDEMFEFEGNNCNEIEDNECSGWDGESGRCDCSNRRVSWVLSDCKKFIYAKAY